MMYYSMQQVFRNFAVTNNSEAKNWRWQPTAWAGMKVTF